jgi:predicted transcriptional regulator
MRDWSALVAFKRSKGSEYFSSNGVDEPARENHFSKRAISSLSWLRTQLLKSTKTLDQKIGEEKAKERHVEQTERRVLKAKRPLSFNGRGRD